jgi:hypothetical protein
MAKRIEQLNRESLGGVFANHPYLRIFQKEDWQEYVAVIAAIYDVLEEEGTRTAYEVIRTILLRCFSEKELQNVDQKVSSFLSTAIAELDVLRDWHDHTGQRFIEGTRSGKEMLKLFESLVAQRAKFTGASAETLLGSLNNMLLSRQQMSLQEAIQHHRSKIKGYQEDLKRIETMGLVAAELLPMDYSSEELFNQAEESAIYLLTAIEDVKAAIEKVRRELAQTYFNKDATAGQAINLVADFYQNLSQTPQFRSYTQATEMLSYLDAYGSRFKNRDLDLLLSEVSKKELVAEEHLKRSFLKGFKQQFEGAHREIETIRQAQLKILQQQVNYALLVDAQRLHGDIREIFSVFNQNKDEALLFWDDLPQKVDLPMHAQVGAVSVNEFEVITESPAQALSFQSFDEAEIRAFAEAILASEEQSVQKIVEELLTTLYRHKGQPVTLSQYENLKSLGVYYVLSEVELFTDKIEKKMIEHEKPIVIDTSKGRFVFPKSPDYLYAIKAGL